MKLSHIIYRGKTLEGAVDKFTKLGFNVEYGSKKNPHNALIYFSEGPYIELLAEAPLSFMSKLILRFIAKGRVLKRLQSWAEGPEGFFEICLENYKKDFKEERKIMDKYKQAYFITKSERLDPKDRLLKWKLLFPHDLDLPFFMTYFFDIDVKADGFVHPNGVKGIKQVSYGVDATMIPMLQELCDDPLLDWFEGKGFGSLEYEK